jgi:hypothetical protein
MAAYLVLAPTLAPREPFGGAGWEVESVMIVGACPTTYNLDPPFRVLRGGRVTLDRRAEDPTLPVVRVDLTIDGEHVVVFARLRQPAGPAATTPGRTPPPAAAWRPPG